MTLVAIRIKTGPCRICKRRAQEHGVKGRCLAEPGKPIEPESTYESNATVYGFVDADDRQSIFGGHLHSDIG